jgi:hypothetical protein
MTRVRVLDSDFWFAANFLWMIGWGIVAAIAGAAAGLTHLQGEAIACVAVGPFLVAVAVALIRHWAGMAVAAWRKAGDRG